MLYTFEVCKVFIDILKYPRKYNRGIRIVAWSLAKRHFVLIYTASFRLSNHQYHNIPRTVHVLVRASRLRTTRPSCQLVHELVHTHPKVFWSIFYCWFSVSRHSKWIKIKIKINHSTDKVQNLGYERR